jgi:hypothetical protein
LGFAGDFLGEGDFDFFGEDSTFLGVNDSLFTVLRLRFETGCTSEPSLSSASSVFSRFRLLVDSVSFALAVSLFLVLEVVASCSWASGSAPLLALCRFPPNARVVCFFGACSPLALPPKNRLWNPNH